MSYKKYYIYKEQYSNDGGLTWNDYVPSVTKPGGDPIGTYDTLEECEASTPPPTPPSTSQYLTFVAKSSGIYDFVGESGNLIQYSTDSGTTWSSPITHAIVQVKSGDIVMWKGTMLAPDIIHGIGSFSATTGTFDVEGNIMSLVYNDIFEDKTSLDELMIFMNLFSGCTTLVNAENLSLPATTLIGSCYEGMFKGCTSLISAPVLPADTMATMSYYNMFNGCTSLTTAPELPATNLWSLCYSNMFSGCTSLINAPSILPGTDLCCNPYIGMFSNCTSLTTAPELVAAELCLQCYNDMFDGCSSLNYIKCLAHNDVLEHYPLAFWVRGVSPTGTFVKAAGVNWDIAEASNDYAGIPSGWNVIEYSPPVPQEQQYLTLVAHNNGTFMFDIAGRDDNIYYSLNNSGTWIKNSFVNVNAGDKVRWKGTLLPDLSEGIGSFIDTTGNFTVEGNAMSLVGGDYFTGETSMSDWQFANLFSGCTGLKKADNLVLPVTNLTRGCYEYMFDGCTGLTAAPILSATTLVTECYHAMFRGCTNLNSIICLATSISASKCTENWVQGVQTISGTFTKSVSMSSWTTGTNGIPSGWNVLNALTN